MNSESTYCYSYFAICSKGDIVNGIGFVASPNSDFDPDYITARLGIIPDETRRMGADRKNGHGKYPFSDWSCCYQDTPAIDAEAQCVTIVRTLQEKVPELVEIKKEFNVAFSIIVVPNIYNERTPILGFNKEIIEFCYRTGTEIGIDLYVYGADTYEP